MAVIFIPITGLLIWLTLMQRTNLDPRDAFIRTFIWLFAFIALTTEILSVFAAIRVANIALIWLTTAIGLGCVLWSHGHIARPIVCWKALNVRECFMVIGVAAMTGLLLAIALAAPPTTYDAQSYHLPRVCHWIRQQSVMFFSTANSRQNIYQPLAEYAMLHLRLLSGSDRFFNLVQWSGFIASICLVSLLARELGLNRRGQLLAALFAATIPMVVLQATSCQNDLIAASFCLMLVYALVRLSTTDKASDAWFGGLALGTAILCKGTSYFFCLPPLVIFGIRYLLRFRSRGVGHVILRWMPVVLIAVAINTGFWTRNWLAFGDPLGGAQQGVANSVYSNMSLAANIVRNLGSHLGTPLPGWNAHVSALVTKVGQATPTFGDAPFRVTFVLFEDDTGNLLHLLLAICCLGVWFFRQPTRQPLAGLLVAAGFCSAMFLCILLLWQPWITRFHTYFFLLLAPVCAWMLSTRPRLASATAMILLVGALPFLMLNVSRPVFNLSLFKRFAPSEMHDLLKYRPSVFLAPRMAQYFGRDVLQRQEFEQAMHWLPHEPNTTSGLVVGGDDLEYRLWVIAEKELGGQLPRFRSLIPNPAEDQAAVHPPVIFDIRRMQPRPPPYAGCQPLYEAPNITVWRSGKSS